MTATVTEMHITPARQSCWTAEATERRWLWFDRHQPSHRAAKDPTKACHFSTWPEDQRRKVQGSACDGCARLVGGPHV
jgi:hypothetical protein